MANATQTDRSSVSTPLFAVVGATDLAVERVRAVQADVERRVGDFDARSLGAKAQELPTLAAARAAEVASKGQARYQELAVRGKTRLNSIRSQASTQHLINQAENTVSRSRAAVTTARKAADDTYSAILSTFRVGRGEAEEAGVTTRSIAKTAARRTTIAAKKSTATLRKGAAATKSAAKGTRTSAGQIAPDASEAASDAAGQIGE